MFFFAKLSVQLDLSCFSPIIFVMLQSNNLRLRFPRAKLTNDISSSAIVGLGCLCVACVRRNMNVHTDFKIRIDNETPGH